MSLVPVNPGARVAGYVDRERRDPQAATNPVVYQTPGHPQVPNWDAHNALRWGYYANTFVYRGIQCIAQDLSSLPIRVGADPEKPADFDPANPLARLLGPPPYGPNRNTSARQFIAWTVGQYLACGRFGWELELPTGTIMGQPIGLWPLPAPYLKPIPSESGARYFTAYEFGRSGEEKRLSADRVFYHWRPKQDDWRQPESALDAGRYDISVAVMQDRYDYAFLRNDARPAAVVIYEGFATEDEDRAFKRDWAGQYRGPENAGKAAFIEADRDGNGDVGGALEIKTLGLTQKDARFIERYEAKINAILMLLGVPKSRLGDASGRTFANASEEWKGYWQTTIRDLAYDLQDAINIGLAPLFGQNVVWFDFTGVEALRPPKRFASATETIAAYQAQLITGDEARTEWDLAPMDLGLRTMPEVVPAPPVAEAARAAEEPESRDAAITGPGPAAQPAGAERAVQLAPAGPDWGARALERRAKAVISSTAQTNALEQTWERAFKRLFQRQAQATLARLNGKRGRQSLRESRADVSGVFDKNHWEKVTADEAEDLVAAVFAAGGGRVANDLGATFELDQPYVQEFIRNRANKLAGQVTDTTYRQITDQLAEGVGKGETIKELAQRVQHVFDVADTRAETIARTEVISAYNGSAMTIAAQLPADVVGGQEWVAVEDARTRPEHAAADGEIVPIGDPFVGTGEPLAYPGDPSGSPANIVNCRCTVAFLTPDEMDARHGRVETRAALALLAMVRAGEQIDEFTFRRALREARAA